MFAESTQFNEYTHLKLGKIVSSHFVCNKKNLHNLYSSNVHEKLMYFSCSQNDHIKSLKQATF